MNCDVARMTWREVEAALRGRPAGLLPVGAIEAHGPHLPLETDVIIATEMARRAAAVLGNALIFPPVYYSSAPFAAPFAGTLSVGGHAQDVVDALRELPLSCICLVNSHLDPAHLAELRAIEGVVFPDKTRRPWALRLPDEFQHGGPHAGRYETSLVMAARPEAVREEIRRTLPRVDVDLGKAIRDGAQTFIEIGAGHAYTGDPASASAEEGERIYAVLTEMIVAAVKEAS